MSLPPSPLAPPPHTRVSKGKLATGGWGGKTPRRPTSMPLPGDQVLGTGAGLEGGLTFHHAAQEPAGSSGRPGPSRRPSPGCAVFSGGRSCRRLQRSPRGGGRIGAALALPLLQRRLALLLHHPPASSRRHRRRSSSSASVRWATGPEPCKGPRLRARASRAPSPPPPPFPLPLGGGPSARMRRAAAPARALCQPLPPPGLGAGSLSRGRERHFSCTGGGPRRLLPSSASVALQTALILRLGAPGVPKLPLPLPLPPASCLSALRLRHRPAQTGP